MDDLIAQIDLKFQSGNSVPVDRAVVTAAEWKLLREYIYHLECSVGMHLNEEQPC